MHSRGPAERGRSHSAPVLSPHPDMQNLSLQAEIERVFKGIERVMIGFLRG